MPAKPITLGFYECATSAEAKNMIKCLRDCAAETLRAPVDEKKGKPKIQMEYLKDYGDIIYGIMKKGKKSKGITIGEFDNPSKINEVCSRPLDTKPHEFLLGLTHFVYSERLNILIYEENGSGVSCSRFSDYVSGLAHKRINLIPIFTNKSHESVRSGKWYLRMLEFKITSATSIVMSKSKSSKYSWWNKSLAVYPVEPGGIIAVKLAREKKLSLGKDIFFMALSLMNYNDHDKKNRAKAIFVDPEGNADRPVDLIKDRLKKEVTPPEVEYMTKGELYDVTKFYEILERKMKNFEFESNDILKAANDEEGDLL